MPVNSFFEQIAFHMTDHRFSSVFPITLHKSPEGAEYFLLPIPVDTSINIFQVDRFTLVGRHLRFDKYYNGSIFFSDAHYTEHYFCHTSGNTRIIHVYLPKDGKQMHVQVKENHPANDLSTELTFMDDSNILKNLQPALQLFGQIRQKVQNLNQELLNEANAIEQKLSNMSAELLRNHKLKPVQRIKLLQEYEDLAKKFVAKIRQINDLFYCDLSYKDRRGELTLIILTRITSLISSQSLETEVVAGEKQTVGPVVTASSIAQDLSQELTEVEQESQPSAATQIEELLSDLEKNQAIINGISLVGLTVSQAIINRDLIKQKLFILYLENGCTERQWHDFENIVSLRDELYSRCMVGDIEVVKALFNAAPQLITIEFVMQLWRSLCVGRFFIEEKPLEDASSIDKGKLVTICDFLNEFSPIYKYTVRQINYASFMTVTEEVSVKSSLLTQLSLLKENYDFFEMLLRHGIDLNNFGCINGNVGITNIAAVAVLSDDPRFLRLLIEHNCSREIFCQSFDGDWIPALGPEPIFTKKAHKRSAAAQQAQEKSKRKAVLAEIDKKYKKSLVSLQFAEIFKEKDSTLVDVCINFNKIELVSVIASVLSKAEIFTVIAWLVRESQGINVIFVLNKIRKSGFSLNLSEEEKAELLQIQHDGLEKLHILITTKEKTLDSNYFILQQLLERANLITSEEAELIIASSIQKARYLKESSMCVSSALLYYHAAVLAHARLSSLEYKNYGKLTWLEITMSQIGLASIDLRHPDRQNDAKKSVIISCLTLAINTLKIMILLSVGQRIGQRKRLAKIQEYATGIKENIEKYKMSCELASILSDIEIIEQSVVKLQELCSSSASSSSSSSASSSLSSSSSSFSAHQPKKPSF